MPDVRPTLLVADDYPENCKLFSIYLRAGYDVVTALSAEDAAERLAGGGVDAALLDLNYQGGMTGLDLIAHIRADPASGVAPDDGAHGPRLARGPPAVPGRRVRRVPLEAGDEGRDAGRRRGAGWPSRPASAPSRRAGATTGPGAAG